MDLNQLLYHHQIALMQDGAAPPLADGMVDHYARRIRSLRSELGLAPLAGWMTSGTRTA